MFWKHTASFILKNRLIVLICVIALSTFMGFEAAKVKITFNGGKVLPVTDSAYIRYNQFKKTFGQDASSMVIGIKSDKIFDKDVFNDWYRIGTRLQQIKGIKAVVSIANIYNLQKDTAQHRFVIKPLVSQELPTAQAVDSVKQQLLNLPFYKGLVLSNDGKSTLMAVTFDDKIINTPYRVPIIKKMTDLGMQFEQKHGIKVHYSGLPLIRTVVGDLVSHEFSMFLSLSILITALILLLFFRSFFPVIFPVLIVVLGVVWSLGVLVLMHYEMTILTGIIPPLVVVIGIPNTIFILNKYYHEFEISGDKMEALKIALEKAGITTFIANITTAIGFGVLCFTNSELLTQFGLVASLSILATFALSLILVPIVFSYLPKPKAKQTGIKHRKWMKALLAGLDGLVHQKRKVIYITTLVLIGISVIGIYRININGYVVDDLPQNNNTLTDLKFFESNFNGVLPLEVSIDTRRKNGVMNQGTIRRVEKLERLISSYPEFSRSISLIQVLKFSTQAFYGGNPEYYRLPDGLEQNFILNYAGNSGKSSGTLNSYLDSTHQVTRVTFEMVDAGSKKMNAVLAELQPRIDSIFNPKKFHVELTGSSIIFIKGTNYLLKNLYESLAWAILLIAGVMWILFRGIKMIAVSLVPNLVPLIITAGIMGFFGIPLKPSTILIFSIAMGISSDQTIYFITRYRHELRHSAKSISQIISDTIRETGVSMIFIATVLFFGFGIFAVSKFGGTVALGILLSITLLVAMISNLTLLPAFLLSLDGGVDRKKLKGPDIEE
ncbi:efflux RND transporter permease subunit [Mucilaginibacter pocheonensis]|uniref:RND superfamily exporter protein n=1 Tax=Mucilaginibacter pocheonensis TaxID=398050 RepID=A0ABU1T9V8_9SPHI|nr:MMPL family transporter [Mucilaginibacter pocheonensis]MDR6942094.1 putative RND superfamily exporter protein [Mucilaginibacter pocheonensis]